MSNDGCFASCIRKKKPGGKAYLMRQWHKMSKVIYVLMMVLMVLIILKDLRICSFHRAIGSGVQK